MGGHRQADDHLDSAGSQADPRRASPAPARAALPALLAAGMQG